MQMLTKNCITRQTMRTIALQRDAFLNQARAGLRPERAWFLEITFIPPKYVCVYVCVSTPEAINN